jgi:4-diphosphocytidyl-2-C-methyl-D-erythritol kinase
VIGEIKQKLYDSGAIYASMSGSGSAVYGLFEETPKIEACFPNDFIWISK